MTMEEALESADLVWNTNAVLATAGITERVTTVEEVVQACAQTSFVVAAVETLLAKQIAIVRHPRLQAERAANLDTAVSMAEQLVHCLSGKCLGLLEFHERTRDMLQPSGNGSGKAPRHRLVPHLWRSHHIWTACC
jgi:hypothetical protein